MLNIAPKVRFDTWTLTFKAKQKKTLTKDNKSFLSYYSTIRLWGHMLLQAEIIRLCVHATLKNFSVQHCNDVNSYFFLQYRCHGLEFFTCVPKNKQVIRNRSRINDRRGFYLSNTPYDWLKDLVPLFPLIRSKTITNCDTFARVFPRFASSACNYFEFWLVNCIFCVLCDWLKW